jgi:hypothetical protein
MRESEVPDALRALDPYLSEEGYAELLPYLVDALRERGLLTHAADLAVVDAYERARASS